MNSSYAAAAENILLAPGQGLQIKKKKKKRKNLFMRIF